MAKFTFNPGDIVSEDGIDYTIVDINENVVTLADPNDEEDEFEIPYEDLEDIVDLDDSEDEEDGQLDELNKKTLIHLLSLTNIRKTLNMLKELQRLVQELKTRIMEKLRKMLNLVLWTMGITQQESLTSLLRQSINRQNLLRVKETVL